MTRGLVSPDVIGRQRRKPKPRYPSTGELARTIMDVRRDAVAILPMYQRLQSLGLEPPRGESVHTGGSPSLRPDGSVTGYVPELAIESERAESRRAYAEWVGRELAVVAKRLDHVRQGLERNVGPTQGYRQPESLGSDAFVTVDEFAQARENQANRLKRGAE